MSPTQAETITLSLTSESFLSVTGACADPLGPYGPYIRSLPPDEIQAVLDALGFSELPPPCTGPESVAGLTGTLELEITPQGLNTPATISVLSADIGLQDTLNLEFDLGFLGRILTDVESGHLNVHTQGSPVAVQPNGSFSLANHEFLLDGGSAHLSATGAIGNSFTPTVVNLSTQPAILSVGTYVEGQGVQSLDLQGILDGGIGSQGENIVQLALPLSLFITPGEFDEEMGAIGYDNLDGMIIATGTSSFAVPATSFFVVPEPSTLMLAMLGLPLLGLLSLRTRKRKFAARA